VRITIVNIDSLFDKEQKETIKSFIKFIQERIKLFEDTSIYFTNSREGSMTTGVRKKHHKIVVLCKDRLLIDILRTLAHEWVHEYQHQTNYTKKHKHQDIGGPIENDANILAGILLKLFQKEYPDFDKILYNE